MRDYADIKAGLSFYAATACDENETKCLLAAADAIEELLAEKVKIENSGKLLAASFERLKEKVPQWISVEERLPEESGYTIVYCADGDRRHVTFAKYQKTPKRWELSGARSYWRVLKWMPLPAPPKGVE